MSTDESKVEEEELEELAAIQRLTGRILDSARVTRKVSAEQCKSARQIMDHPKLKDTEKHGRRDFQA